MEALLSFFAAWCEPVQIVCCRCECKWPRDTASRVEDVFGHMSQACQPCADAAEAEERRKFHKYPRTGFGSRASGGMR